MFEDAELPDRTHLTSDLHLALLTAALASLPPLPGASSNRPALRSGRARLCEVGGTPIPSEPVRAALEFHGIALVDSASSVLSAMNAEGLSPLELSTDQELFTIIYGKAVILEFLPSGESTVDPADSRLATVQYNFGPEYVGKVAPLLSATS